MKVSNIVYALSRLWVLLGASYVLPLAFSIAFRDGLHFVFLAHIAGLLGLSLLSRVFRIAPRELTIREGFLIVTICWVSFTVFGATPFMVTGYIPSFTDAFFETMSGFSTTGATILTDIERLPKSLLLWRNMTQWLGGMGVIALAVAVFPFLGVGGTQLFKAEVPGPTKDKISPRISETAKLLWAVYLLLTVAQTALLMAGGLSLFDALCVTFGTLATGGFVPHNASIAAFPSPYVQYIITFFMFCAGVNFSLHFWALKGKVDRYYRNPEFRCYAGIIGGAFLIILATRYFHGTPFSESAVRGSLFQVVSIITTTGFITEDYEHWPFATQVILILLMVVGGCAGSTGGAMKNVRILVLFKYCGAELKRLFYPHGVFPVKLEYRPVPEGIVLNIMGFIAMYALFFVFGTLAMAILGLDIDTSIGAVAATLGNVGPGLGTVGPVDNFAHVPTLGKWVLSFLMLAGRLEIYTVVVIFMPRFWK